MSKFFNVNNPNEIVTIISEHPMFYQLSDGNMIKKETFSTKYQPVLEGFEYEEFNQSSDIIDPNSFFAPQQIINQDDISSIVNTDTTNMVDSNERTTVIKKDELTNVYQQSVASQSVQNTQSKIDEINHMYDDEKMVYGEAEATLRRNKRLKPYTQQTQEVVNTPPQHTQPVQQIDPVKMMFSTFKRNHEITFNFEFKDKIANPEFIKLMVENMDGDIIGYYKDLIMKNIINNISDIEQIVEDKLNIIINGEQKQKKSFVPRESLELIKGGVSKSGKQLYKYINDKGNIVELLPETASKKKFIPYKYINE